MVKRYIGDCEIRLHFCGRTQDNRAKYLGCIILPDGRRHTFMDLCSAVSLPGKRAEDYDSMADAAVGFAAYYTSDNRDDDTPDWAHDDTPDWAPAAELADAIAKATEWDTQENGDYMVRRVPDGPGR